MLRVAADAVDHIARLQLASADAEHRREQREPGMVQEITLLDRGLEGLFYRTNRIEIAAIEIA